MHKARITVYGMDCPSCSSAVERVVKRSIKADSVRCNYLENVLYIEYSQYVDFSLLSRKLSRYGYRIPEDTYRVSLSEEGKALRDLFLSSFEGASEWTETGDGDTELKVVRTGDTEGELIAFFLAHGQDVSPEEIESGDETVLADSQIDILRNLTLSVILTLPLLWGPSPCIQFVLASLILLFPGRRFYRGMVLSVKSGKLNMDVLTALSTSVVYLFSTYTVFTEREDIKLYFLCQGVLVSMLLFGRYLESVARGEATRTLRRLMGLIPRKVRVIEKDGSLAEKDISTVSRNEMIALKKGERIPLDGIVEDGECLVDESVMTGESILIRKGKGDSLLSGTVLRDGSVSVRVISKREDSAIERVVEIVRNAERWKTPEEKMADRIASYFIPSVIIIAAFVFLLWYFILAPSDLEKALVTAAGVLVVACPCALGLAVPTSIMVSSGKAAEMGILFKNTAVFSLLGKTDTVAVDKTGTLTTGSAIDGKEELRSGASDFVASMRRRGIDPILISGDSKNRAESVAGSLSITEVLYGAKSEDKARIIKTLRKEGHNVLMVGDGVNDAPAMSVSNVSISLGNATQIAKDAADIIILNDDLDRIDDAFSVSKKVVRNIRENLIWAILYNAVAIPLASAGIMNPSIASAAMSFSSIAVLMNSLRLGKMDVRKRK